MTLLLVQYTLTFASVLILGEPLGAIQALGGALILGFTAWNEIGGKKS